MLNFILFPVSLGRNARVTHCFTRELTRNHVYFSDSMGNLEHKIKKADQVPAFSVSGQIEDLNGYMTCLKKEKDIYSSLAI